MDAATVLACDHDDARALVATAIAAGQDAASFVLAHGASPWPAAGLAEQIHCWPRLQAKLPSWAAAGCLVTRRALEQASSEVAARAVAAWLAPRGRVLDLTAGLGVDAWALAEAHAPPEAHALPASRAGAAATPPTVTACEANPDLAALTATNQRRLASRVSVVAGDSLAHLASATWDLVWADPDRRPDGQRVTGIAAGRPDLIAAQPSLRRQAAVSAVKLAPSLGHDELSAAFPDATDLVQVGAGGECNAWIVRSDHRRPPSGAPRVAALLAESQTMITADDGPSAPVTDALGPWLGVPEAALGHAGLAPIAAASVGMQPWQAERGWWTGQHPPPVHLARPLRLLTSGAWQLKAVRKALRQHGVDRVNVTSHDPRLSAQRLTQDLRLRSGGTRRLLLQPDARGRRWWVLGEAA